MSKCLIIIPAFNEADNIVRVVDPIIEKMPGFDYVIVNDGSSDDTEKICKEKGYNVINLPINVGIGGAVQAGYRYAKNHDYDIAIQFDGDGQHDIAYLEQMKTILEGGEADIVIGSRFMKKEGFQSTASRRMGITLLSSLIFLCTGKKVYDVTSGYRAVNRYFIKIYAENYPDDYPEPEAIVSAVMHRGVIKEIPVVMHEREYGESSITFVRSIYYMIKVSLAIVICRISFGIRRGKRCVEHS